MAQRKTLSSLLDDTSIIGCTGPHLCSTLLFPLIHVPDQWACPWSAARYANQLPIWPQRLRWWTCKWEPGTIYQWLHFFLFLYWRPCMIGLSWMNLIWAEIKEWEITPDPNIMIQTDSGLYCSLVQFVWADLYTIAIGCRPKQDHLEEHILERFVCVGNMIRLLPDPT